VATVGGDILQRTRCTYFYDDSTRCNKRAPGAGCDAIDGINRIHAILGASPACVATHPSDMCVGLTALDAVVTVEGQGGSREIALVDLHRLPGGAPEVETELRPGELITAVTLPANGFASRSSSRLKPAPPFGSSAKDMGGDSAPVIRTPRCIATASRSRSCWPTPRSRPITPRA
jgi:xanthine dehydrogenase YagS FAD-binding subunit